MKTTELFELLKRNPSGHAFTIVEYPGHRDVYIGTDVQGRPCLFVRTSELLTEPPLRTAEVSLRIGQDYEVAPLGQNVRRDRFHFRKQTCRGEVCSRWPTNSPLRSSTVIRARRRADNHSVVTIASRPVRVKPSRTDRGGTKITSRHRTLFQIGTGGSASWNAI